MLPQHSVIRASTEPPRDTTAFTLVLYRDVELYVWAPGGLLPDELEVRLHGRHRPRVEASWNGCAFLIYVRFPTTL